MESVSSKAARIRSLAVDRSYIDLNYPHWARRSHPLVRRHLGPYWRVIPPQFETYLQWYLVQVVIIFLTIPLGFLFTVLVPLVLIALALLPISLFYYSRTLYALASDSSRAMVADIENHTLPLVLATPLNLREILLSRVAGAMWKQSEALAMLLAVATFTQLPTLMMIYVNRFPVEEFGITAHIFMLLLLGSSIVRLPLEMFMVSAIGLYIGVTTHGRNTAAATALTLVIFYFVLINLPRLLSLPAVWLLLVEGLLPAVMPTVFAWLFLKGCEREIQAQ